MGRIEEIERSVNADLLNLSYFYGKLPSVSLKAMPTVTASTVI